MEHIKAMVIGLTKGTTSVDELFQAVTQEIVDKVGSTRASVWVMNEYKDAITSLDLIDTRTGAHAKGVELHKEDFPAYFKAIVTGDVMIASDALSHPATSCFNELYFDPLDIKSLLDVPILVGGQVAGVLCCEHCEDRIYWNDDHIQFLQGMGTILNIVFKLGKVSS